MKITAGFSGIEQYRAYAQAGADELFCGYVPDGWTEKYGTSWPLNRREVKYCPVQIGGQNALHLLGEARQELRKPVALTFNSPCYHPDQLSELGEIMLRCMEAGFRRFIIADPALLVYLHQKGYSREIELHISGEMGEVNRYVLRQWRYLGANRIILHRKVGLVNMEALIQGMEGLSFEAFAMNEMCHFHGAFCASLHCDELAHLCHVPWQLSPVREGEEISAITSPQHAGRTDVPGFSGCGLCALWKLRAIGVEYLKVVGRGANTDEMIRDISALRRSLELMEECGTEEEWLERMKREIFATGCSGNCYYR